MHRPRPRSTLAAPPRAKRRPNPARPSVAIALGLLGAAALACAGQKPIDTVIFPELSFDAEAEPIAPPIELCVPPSLRKRQWKPEAHPYRVDIGPRTALYLERMVKARFGDVEVTFGKNCGASTGHPWITLRIVSAHREPYAEVDAEDAPLQYTAVETRTALHADSGEVLWETEQDGVVGKPLPLGGHAFFANWDKGSLIFFPFDVLAMFEDRERLEAAQVDFGEALAAALLATNDALVRDAEEIALMLPAPPSGPTEKEATATGQSGGILEEISPIVPN